MIGTIFLIMLVWIVIALPVAIGFGRAARDKEPE